MKLLQPTAFLGNFVRFVGESANWPVLYKRSLVLQDEPLLIQYKVELNRFAVGCGVSLELGLDLFTDASGSSFLPF